MMKLKKSVFFYVANIVAALSLQGCSWMEKDDDYGFVQREWSLALNELGISPVFPPREDFFVGDVYVTPYNPQADEVINILLSDYGDLTEEQKATRRKMGVVTRLGRLDFSEMISAEYRKTLSAPQTSPEFNQVLNNPAVAEIERKISVINDSLESIKRSKSVSSERVSQSDLELTGYKREKDDISAMRSPDLVSIDAEIALANNKVYESDRKIIELNRKREDSSDADKPSVSEEIKIETRKNQDAQALLKKLQENQIDKKNVLLKNIETKIAITERELADKRADQTKQNAEFEPKIASANEELTKLAALKKSISDAGARHLYAQPQYTDQDVFTGHEFSDGADKLNSRVTRLRLAAFPEYSIATMTKGNLSAIIPIDAINMGINLNQNSISSVSVKVPFAESYALDLNNVVNALLDDSGRPLGDFDSYIKAAYKIYGDQSKVCKDNGNLYFTVVSEVFYTRAIDVGISSEDSSAFNVNASLLSGISTMPLSQSVPGGSVQVVSANSNSIGLRRVYDRPIAIGYRGMIMDACGMDQKPTIIGVGTTPIPLMILK